jgi:hypothetical protein
LPSSPAEELLAKSLDPFVFLKDAADEGEISPLRTEESRTEDETPSSSAIRVASAFAAAVSRGSCVDLRGPDIPEGKSPLLFELIVL